MMVGEVERKTDENGKRFWEGKIGEKVFAGMLLAISLMALNTLVDTVGGFFDAPGENSALIEQHTKSISQLQDGQKECGEAIERIEQSFQDQSASCTALIKTHEGIAAHDGAMDYIEEATRGRWSVWNEDALQRWEQENPGQKPNVFEIRRESEF